MQKRVRIANCSGFYGDRISAAKEMVEGGPIDVLTGDWLAELTMLILARNRAKPGGKGYATTFISQMEQVLASCLEKGIKVVSNAGGLDPQGCAEAIKDVATKLGLNPRIAYVTGDDLLPRMAELGQEIKSFETGQPLGSHRAQYLTANVYLGGWGITEALRRGADIVITGRVTDAALISGAAAWFHDWSADDLDALAGAVVAGHVIECGTQATGGNYSFFQELPGLDKPGFPWADVFADGSALIGKHEGTGGRVCAGTVVSQLLYEIGGVQYFGPDVTTRFDTIKVEEISEDRVLLSGAKGERPPATLKVALNEVGGYRNDLSIALTGLDIEAKAELVERSFWRANPYTPDQYQSVTTQLVRTDKTDPASNEEAVAVWNITLKDPDARKVGRAAFNAVSEMALASIPGFFRIGGQNSKAAREYGVYRPATVPRWRVVQQVHMLSGDVIQVKDIYAEAGRCAVEQVRGNPLAEDQADPSSGTYEAGKTIKLPLGRLVGARSGDKGGNANLGVFVRQEAGWPWLKSYLTVDKLRELLPEVNGLHVERFELPNLYALNFVIHGLLQEGVAASTRQDRQAKSLCEWFRARIGDLPCELLSPEDTLALSGEDAKCAV